MNKALSLLIIGFFCFFVSNAQEFSFGIKGGPSYVMGGQITGSNSGLSYYDGTLEADSKINFHGGGFFEVRFDKFLVRPELIYSQMSTEFPFPDGEVVYEVEKISVPLLVGYNVWGPIDVYAGPAFQKILNSSLTRLPNSDLVVQNSPLAAQAGIKAGFGRFEIDLRYDRTLSSKEAIDNLDFDNDDSGTGLNKATFDDTRLNQILLSISFKIFDSAANPGRRKGGCYF